MAIPVMAIFVKIFLKSCKAGIGENLGIHPSYHFCDFPSLNDNIVLNMKNLTCLGIQPSYGP